MELKEYIKEIEKFIADYLNVAHAKGYVLGISGGVDSSLSAVLTANAIGRDSLLCVIIPIESNNSDIKDAIELCSNHNLNYIIYNGDDIYHSYIKELTKLGIEIDQSTKGNLKARIRMTILYALAQKHNYLVLGTDNADERYTGYFTKYGDGGVDILPLAHLTKCEVVEAAKLVGIKSSLAERTPTAGLFEGQTDEKEMGILYKDLDNYLLGNKIDKLAQEKIEHLHKISAHKRDEIPTPKEFIRK